MNTTFVNDETVQFKCSITSIDCKAVWSNRIMNHKLCVVTEILVITSTLKDQQTNKGTYTKCTSLNNETGSI